jgi:hypothetical protein
MSGKCPWCDGTGKRPYSRETEDCTQCDGRGVIFDGARVLPVRFFWDFGWLVRLGWFAAALAAGWAAGWGLNRLMR